MIGVVISISLPIFIVFIVAESLLAPKRYNLADSLSSLTSLILMEVLFHTLRKLVPLVPYTFIYEHLRLIDSAPVDSWLYWFVCLCAVDCTYYWGHRFSHSCSLAWSGHVVHHSSEFYNFSTALRQGTFEKLFTFPRFFPLAILGLPPLCMMVLNEIDTVLMFFVHTETIGKLWWPIEFIFVTPSHHRVHHARNKAYLDKNFGGALIVWDRLFGTFEEEREQPVYGLVHPLHSFDPIYVQFQQLVNCLSLAYSLRNRESLRVALQSLFYGPSWHFDSVTQRWRQHEIPHVDASTPKEFLVNTDDRLKRFLIIQFSITALLGFLLTSYWNSLPSYEAIVCTAFVVSSFVSISELSMINIVDRSSIVDFYSHWRKKHDLAVAVIEPMTKKQLLQSPPRSTTTTLRSSPNRTTTSTPTTNKFTLFNFETFSMRSTKGANEPRYLQTLQTFLRFEGIKLALFIFIVSGSDYVLILLALGFLLAFVAIFNTKSIVN